MDPLLKWQKQALTRVTRKLRGTLRKPYYEPVTDTMGKQQRDKGNNFERKVAKVIIEACAPLGGLGYKDCFRTPLSGGHAGCYAGDLTISPKLKKTFPWTVECKHYGNWTPGVMFEPREQESNWYYQLLAACKRNKQKGKIPPPLLIISGNRTGLFFASRYNSLVKRFPGLEHWSPSLRFHFRGRPNDVWLMLPEADFAYHLNERAKRFSTLYNATV